MNNSQIIRLTKRNVIYNLYVQVEHKSDWITLLSTILSNQRNWLIMSRAMFTFSPLSITGLHKKQTYTYTVCRRTQWYSLLPLTPQKIHYSNLTIKNKIR